MPLEWSSGWLFEQMAKLDGNAEEWWKSGPVGFFDDSDPEYDPLWDASVSPPVGWERLPMHEEVSDGE